jgi:hypothetical protein
MAKIIRETMKDTVGREVGLALAGRFFLVLGIVAILVSIVLMILSGDFFWVAYGAVCMIFTVVLFLIFTALSEIIILLKKLCGLPSGGAVSGNTESSIFICSECGSMVWPDSTKCAKCGAGFEGEDSLQAIGEQGDV